MAAVAFIQNLSFEYLGVMYLSGVLRRQSHRTEVFIEHGQGLGGISRELHRFQPDIIAFPCITGSHPWVVSAARYLKREFPDARVVLGGPHATYFPEVIAEDPVDIVCRGEGEYALADLADAIDRNSDYRHIANLWVKEKPGVIIKNGVRNLIHDLDTVPFPDRTLYVNKYPYLRKSQKVFITGRGCPFSCTYCFNHSFNELYRGKGDCVRWRSGDNIINEIRAVRDAGGVRTVYLQDDTFGLNRELAYEFLDRYKKDIRLPFICLLRADLCDEPLVSRLKAAGCSRVFFGVETGSENLRTLVLKKTVTDAQIRRAAGLLHTSGIKFRTYNMFGLPGETLEDAYKTVDLNVSIGTDYPWSSLFAPFPGTDLADYARKNGLLPAHTLDLTASFFKKSPLLLKDKRAIQNLHRLFFYAVRFPALWPVIRRMIHARLDGLYELFFLCGYMASYYKSERLTFAETVRIAVHNVRNFLYPKEAEC